MRVIFFILLIITAISTAFFSLSNNEYIIIQWLGFSIEISPILVVISLSSILMISILILHFLLFLKNIPSSLKKHYKEKQDHDDLLLLLDGFEAVYSEDLVKIAKISKKIDAKKDHSQIKLMKPLLLLLNVKINEAKYKIDLNCEEVLDNSYQELLKVQEYKIMGLKGLVTLRVNNKRYHDALFYAEKAYLEQPKSDWLLKYLIKIYMVLEFYELAEKSILKAEGYRFINKEEANDHLLQCYVSNANHVIASGDVKKAILLLEKALKIDPAHLEAVFTLARLYSRDDNKRAAHKVVERAWKKNQSIELARFLLKIYSSYKADKKAKLLENLIDLAPENKTGYLSLAELYIEEGMMMQARAVMDKLLALHAPDSYMSKIMALIETKTQNNHSIIANWLSKIYE